MLVSKGRAVQTWSEKERAAGSAGVKNDDRLAAGVVLHSAFNAVGEESERGKTMECVGWQIPAETFVSRHEDADRIERVAPQVKEVVVVRDVRTL
jgi:hypothetical protein